MPMLSEKSPVSFVDPLPRSVDVVIIGAGIIGISTAWFLLKDGLSVLVCEKGRVGGEQSTRNWGWVRTQGRDPAELPIAIESTGIWEHLSHEIGVDLGFTRQGLMFLSENEKEQSEFEDWLDIAKQYHLDTQVIGAKEVGKKLNYGDHRWLGAMYTPSDGIAEPFTAVPAIARALQQGGAKIIENCAVRTVETEAGVTTHVVTELGRVRTNAVVIAAGAWSSTFLANLGVVLPQLLVKATVVRTKAVSGGYSGGAGSHKFMFRRRQDGGYTLSLGNYLEHYLSADSFRYFIEFLPALKMTWSGIKLRFDDELLSRLFPVRSWQAEQISPFERTRVLNPKPNLKVASKIENLMADNLPVLANAGIEDIWAGMIDAPPDYVPVMDEIPKYKNMYLATGFSGHGFGIGPGAGKVMAKMIQNKEIDFDLSRFRFSRFSDGSRIEPGPAL